MPPANSNTWSDMAEKDLILAMLAANNTSGELKFTANWDKITDIMTTLGYKFTKSAMNQRWSKVILREFKSRHPESGGNASAAPSTPQDKKVMSKNVTTPKSSNKRKRADADDSEVEETKSHIALNRTPRNPGKKPKYEDPETSVDEEDVLAVNEEGAI